MICAVKHGLVDASQAPEHLRALKCPGLQGFLPALLHPCIVICDLRLPRRRQRQMDAAEDLLAEITPDQLYPMEFVVYLVDRFSSGVRHHSMRQASWGKALIRDLGAFIQAISADLGVVCRIVNQRGQAIPLDEVGCSMLQVDRRTVQRRRGDGLVLHWVRDSE